MAAQPRTVVTQLSITLVRRPSLCRRLACVGRARSGLEDCHSVDDGPQYPSIAPGCSFHLAGIRAPHDQVSELARVIEP